MSENLTPEQVVEKINEKFNATLATMPTKSDLDGLKSDVEALKTLEAKSQEIEKAIARFEGKMEAMSEKGFKSERKPRSLGEAISQAYVANIDKIKETAEKGGMMTLETKTLYDTTIDGDYSGNIALSTLEAGVSTIARPIIKIRDIVNMGTTASKFVTYISQSVQTASSWIDEAGVKISGQPSYEEISEEVKKIAGTVKISKEMLSDLAFVQSEINRDLMASVDQAIEAALLNGAMGGINGILTNALPFSAGTFAGTVVTPNISDVIRVTIAQIQNANFEPTHVVLNPEDIAAMQLTKTSTGEYTYPMFLMDVNKVANLIVVSTTNQSAGTFLVGDFSKSNVRMRESMNVQVGYVNDDFQRNMVTILAEARLVQYVKANDYPAFVAGDLATAIAALAV